ncbi:hypothetical protein JOF47_000533 [Paeniglutamicibacter kerguelensis]|uniref:MFS transporter n=1 Tax=Paeniglutamicibacter kerguelensis TaxID=254788 RepID=A0ABS4X978_9MICC|nr:hypothetical protein [Paeniglutamicibacter kerguelensis]
MGHLAPPSFLAQAVAPMISSGLFRNAGLGNTLAALGLFMFPAFALAIWLMLLHHGIRRAADTAAEPAESSLSASPS